MPLMLFPSLILSIDHETQIANNKKLELESKTRQFFNIDLKKIYKKRQLVLCKFHILS